MNENVPTNFVHNKIHVTFHDDRVDYHHGAELIHSKSGHYQNPTQAQHNAAKGTAAQLGNKIHFKNRWKI